MGQGLFNFSANVGGNKDSNKSTNFDVSPFVSAVNTAQGEIGATLRAGTQADVERGKMVQQSLSSISSSFQAGMSLGLQERLQKLQNCEKNARLAMDREKFEMEKNQQALAGEAFSLHSALANDPTNEELQKKVDAFKQREDVRGSGIYANKGFQDVLLPLENKQNIGLASSVMQELNFGDIAQQLQNISPDLHPSEAQILNYMQTGAMSIGGTTIYAKGYDPKTKTYTPLKFASNPAVQAGVLKAFADTQKTIVANTNVALNQQGAIEGISGARNVNRTFDEKFNADIGLTKAQTREIEERAKYHGTTVGISALNARANQLKLDIDTMDADRKQYEEARKEDKETAKGFGKMLSEDNGALHSQVYDKLESMSNLKHSLNILPENAPNEIINLGIKKELNENQRKRLSEIYSSPEYGSLSAALKRGLLINENPQTTIYNWLNPKGTPVNKRIGIPKFDNGLTETKNMSKAVAAVELARFGKVYSQNQDKFKYMQNQYNLLRMGDPSSANTIKDIYRLNPRVDEALSAGETAEEEYRASLPTAPETPKQVSLTQKDVENMLGAGKGTNKLGSFSLGRLTGN